MRSLFVALLGLTFLTSCSDLKEQITQRIPQGEITPQSGDYAAAAPGLRALADGDAATALSRFQVALQTNPTSANLHFLSGIAYLWLQDQQGPSARGLARSAFEVALRNDPTHVPALRELGGMDLKDGRYAQAESRFARAARFARDDTRSLRGLGLSAFLNADYPLAHWASARLPDTDGETWRLRTLTGALGRDRASVQNAMVRFEQLAPGPQQRALVRAVETIDDAYRTLRVADNEPPAAATSPLSPTAVGDASGAVSNSAARPVEAIPGAAMPPSGPMAGAAMPMAGGGGMPGMPGMPGIQGMPGMGTAQGKPMAPSWFDCPQSASQQQMNGMGGGFGGGGFGGGGFGSGGFGGGGFSGGFGGGGFGVGMSGNASADETTILPALPAPCSGVRLPRMVVIDAVIIRTISNGSSSHGINLLDQLSAVLGGGLVTASYNATSSLAGGPSGTGSGRASYASITLPASGIQYSLNIANAKSNRNEVLSRPSLLALDRQPSVFFSGSTLTVALQGTTGGGNLGQLPIGVNLSVTPTFIDDDTALISVKAARSFSEAAAVGTFTQSVQTSRNTLFSNAIMRMGQTLVLSGLTDRELQNTSSETPVLSKLPGIQYLFKADEDQDARTYLIVLLTPRRVDIPRAEGDKPPVDPLSEEDKKQLEDFRRHSASDDHVAKSAHPLATFEALRLLLETNQLYRVVQAGSLDAESSLPFGADRYKFINELKSMLYF